MRSYAKISEI